MGICLGFLETSFNLYEIYVNWKHTEFMSNNNVMLRLFMLHGILFMQLVYVKFMLLLIIFVLTWVAQDIGRRLSI